MSGYSYYLCRVVPPFTRDQPLNDATTVPLPTGQEIVERLRTRFPNITADIEYCSGWLDCGALEGSFNIYARAISISRVDFEQLREICEMLGLVAFDPQRQEFLFMEGS